MPTQNLHSLPPELVLKITRHFSVRQLGGLARTCRSLCFLGSAEVMAASLIRFGGRRSITELLEGRKEKLDIVLALLKKLGPNDKNLAVAMNVAARDGRRDVLDSLAAKYGKYPRTAFYGAAKGGHIDLFNYLLCKKEMTRAIWSESFAAAGSGGQLDFIRFMLDDGRFPISRNDVLKCRDCVAEAKQAHVALVLFETFFRGLRSSVPSDLTKILSHAHIDADSFAHDLTLSDDEDFLTLSDDEDDFPKELKGNLDGAESWADRNTDAKDQVAQQSPASRPFDESPMTEPIMGAAAVEAMFGGLQKREKATMYQRSLFTVLSAAASSHRNDIFEKYINAIVYYGDQHSLYRDAIDSDNVDALCILDASSNRAGLTAELFELAATYGGPNAVKYLLKQRPRLAVLAGKALLLAAQNANVKVEDVLIPYVTRPESFLKAAVNSLKHLDRAVMYIRKFRACKDHGRVDVHQFVCECADSGVMSVFLGAHRLLVASTDEYAFENFQYDSTGFFEFDIMKNSLPILIELTDCDDFAESHRRILSFQEKFKSEQKN
jgi:hypothetical protein